MSTKPTACFQYRHFQWSLMLLLALSTIACSTHQQPDWINNPAAHYPANQYLTALGEGSSREQASQRGRANLSQIFRVAITDSSKDFSQALVNQNTNDKGHPKAKPPTNNAQLDISTLKHKRY
ncbi:LPP20 family lipoprotein [Oceanicoccus sp. KOV_DT_Chl]|uniref:LPP20 family lipoprotein n=1 Tax=Oceanicoccus sp. KOV_DT_Chl TaxID=1904639 RepID=UPI000C7E1399|nr:LPP20 family lipoprotein [Oceanicoccus sp. KOV_DT_Chl]